MPARRSQGRPPGHAPTAAVDGTPGVGGVEQQGVDHGPAPVRAARRARDAGFQQPPAHPGERPALLPDPGEDLADHAGGVVVDVVPRLAAAGLSADVAVTEGRAGQHADGARPGAVPLPAAAALEHLRPLVLGEHPLQLQQQGVLGAVADRPVQEHHPRIRPGELLEQQHLVRVTAGEAVGGVDVDDVDRRERDHVAQALQGGANEGGAAVAVVDEQHRVLDLVTLLRRKRLQLAQLAIDGLPLGLLVGGDPGVDRRTQRRRRRDDPQVAGSHGELPSAVSEARRGLSGSMTPAGVRRRAPTRPGRFGRPRSRPPGGAAGAPGVAWAWWPPSPTGLVGPDRRSGLNKEPGAGLQGRRSRSRGISWTMPCAKLATLSSR